ncbi:MAG: AAA family ATPase [bacterium]|nr:AAA family ATPase [bacterium]
MAPFQVPDAPRTHPLTLDGKMIWIYGEPKIGKTTFAAGIPGAWFVATEKGQDFVTTREPQPIDSWLEFQKFVEWARTNKVHEFGDGEPITHIVIDTYDNLVRMCQEFVEEEMGVEDPSEVPHGRAWNRITRELNYWLGEARRIAPGFVLISHPRQKQFQDRAGGKIDRYEPDVGAAAMRWGLGASDLIIYAHTKEAYTRDTDGNLTGKSTVGRVALVRPVPWAIAGSRMAHYFTSDIIPLSYTDLETAMIPPQEKQDGTKPKPRGKKKTGRGSKAGSTKKRS